MISELAIKLILAGVIVTAVSGGMYGGYVHIKSIGYNEGVVECNKKNKAYEDTVNQKIATIEANSILLVSETRENNAAILQGVGTIIKSTKGKTLTIIKNGECTPSATLSDSIKAINQRVNQSIQGTKP